MDAEGSRSRLKAHSRNYSVRYCKPSLFVRMRHVYPSQGHSLVLSLLLSAIFFFYVLCPRFASDVLVVPTKTQRFSLSLSLSSGMDLYNETQNFRCLTELIARGNFVQKDVCQFFKIIYRAKSEKKMPLVHIYSRITIS